MVKMLKRTADTTTDVIATPTRRMIPLAAVANGMLAGAAGTLAMDIFKYLRYRQTGGDSSAIDYEFMPGLRAWDKAPTPGQVGKRLYEGMLQRPLPERYAPLSSDLVHWGYGIGLGRAVWPDGGLHTARTWRQGCCRRAIWRDSVHCGLHHPTSGASVQAAVGI